MRPTRRSPARGTSRSSFPQRAMPGERIPPPTGAGGAGRSLPRPPGIPADATCHASFQATALGERLIPTAPSDPRGLVRPHDPDHRLPPSPIRRARCVEPSSGADTVNVFVTFDACADGPFYIGDTVPAGARGSGGVATAGRRSGLPARLSGGGGREIRTPEGSP